MNEHTDWPHYETAPRESIFALGVVSINYARFERTVTWVFAAVTAIPEEFAATLIARTNPSDRGRLILQLMDRTEWIQDEDTGEAKELVRHFVAATDILVKNRNFIVHANMIEGTKKRSALYTTTRKGETILIEATLSEIRQVADDLDAFFYFGLALANCIAVRLHKWDRQAGALVFQKWPAKLPLPTLFLKENR